ncbi:MAG: anti-sigma factor [Oscillospiraceae bacterium]|nr:anti-sigma factor [Oscillospiraceae bacterium]
MSDCERWQELMSQMLDDEISPEDAAALRTHMRTCKSCQAMWNLLFTVSHTIQQDVVQPPAALSRDVMTRVRAESGSASKSTGSSKPEKRAHPLPRWTRFAAAACLVIVVGAATYASWNGRGLTGTGSSLSIRSADTAEVETAEFEMEAADEAVSGDTIGDVAAYEEETAEFAEVTEAEANAATSSAAGAALDGGSPAEDEIDGLAVYDMDGNYLGSISEENEDAFAALLDSTAYAESDVELTDICSVEYRGVIYILSTDQNTQLLFWRDAAEGSPFCSTSSTDALWEIIS